MTFQSAWQMFGCLTTAIISSGRIWLSYYYILIPANVWECSALTLSLWVVLVAGWRDAFRWLWCCSVWSNRGNRSHQPCFLAVVWWPDLYLHNCLKLLGLDCCRNKIFNMIILLHLICSCWEPPLPNKRSMLAGGKLPGERLTPLEVTDGRAGWSWGQGLWFGWLVYWYQMIWSRGL